MAELKPLKITIEGVDKVLKDTQKIQNEIKEVQRIAKETKNITLNDQQAREVLRNLKQEAKSTSDEIESIGKNVRFANFKAAMKSVSSELVNIATTAATSGKTASESIKDIGSSLAGIASNFGPIGAAAGAALTLITPVIASLFELSEAEKAVESVTKDATKAYAEEVGALQANISVVAMKIGSEEELKLAKDALLKQYPEYFKNLDIEKLSKEQLVSIEAQLTEEIGKQSIAKAKQAKQSEIYAKIIDAEIRKKKALANQDAEDLNRLGRLATGGIAGIGAANEVRTIDAVNAELEDLKTALTDINSLNIDLNQTLGIQVGLVTKTSNLLTSSFGQAFVKPDTSKGGGGSKTAEKDFQQFGESVEIVTKQLEDLLSGDILNPQEFEEGLKVREELVQRYLSTIKGDSEAVKKATLDNIALESEAVKIVNERIKAEQQAKKDAQDLFGLLAKDRSQLVEGGPSLFGVDDADVKRIKKQALDIAIAVRDGRLTIEQGIEEFKKRGFSAQFLDEQLNIINNGNKRLEEIKKTTEKNQRTIETQSGAESAKERRRLLEEKLKLETEYQKQQEKILKFQIEQEIKAADESRKTAIEAGKRDFEAATNAINRVADETVKAKIEANRKATEQANKIIPDIVKEVNGTFLIDFKKYGDELEKNEAAILKSVINQIQDNAETIVNINLKRNSDLKNEAVKFTDEFITIYKQLNAAELREAIITNKLTIQEADNLRLDELDILKKRVDGRRKLNQAQNDEELVLIQLQREKAIELTRIANDKEYELQIGQRQRELDLAKAAGSDTTVQQKELDLEKIALLRSFRLEEEKVNEEFDMLVDKRRKKNSKEIIKDFTSIAKELQNFSNALIDLLNQQNQQVLDGLNEQLSLVEQAASDTLNRISSLEDDLEGKRSGRREAVLQALEQQRQIEEDLAKQKIALAKQVEAEEKKINKRKQAAAIANAIINGALAITNVFGTTPPPLSFILAGITAATTAVQVATISSQKFAKGGFTGDGGVTDETGHKVAGVVHNDEWVAPKWMVESPKFGGVINQLENARTRGFAEGGFTSPDFNSLSNAVAGNGNAKLENMLKVYTDSMIKLSNRPIYTSATEVQSVVQNANRRKAQATL